MSRTDPRLAPLRAMLAWLPRTDQEILLRAFHRQLHAPNSARELRVAELGFLARLLDELPQPPERRPYIERRIYSSRRAVEAPDSPSAASLCRRYGSWRRSCCAAWGLLRDGRYRYGNPTPRRLPGHLKPPPYTADECIASVHACEQAIRHVPSSHEYCTWRGIRVRRAKELGQSIRLAHYATIVRRLAPEAGRGQGWATVIDRIYGHGRT